MKSNHEDQWLLESDSVKSVSKVDASDTEVGSDFGIAAAPESRLAEEIMFLSLAVDSE